MIAALAYVALALDVFVDGAMPLWPYVDAVLLVIVFTGTASVGLGKNRTGAT